MGSGGKRQHNTQGRKKGNAEQSPGSLRFPPTRSSDQKAGHGARRESGQKKVNFAKQSHHLIETKQVPQLASSFSREYGPPISA